MSNALAYVLDQLGPDATLTVSVPDNGRFRFLAMMSGAAVAERPFEDVDGKWVELSFVKRVDGVPLRIVCRRVAQ